LQELPHKTKVTKRNIPRILFLEKKEKATLTRNVVQDKKIF